MKQIQSTAEPGEPLRGMDREQLRLVVEAVGEKPYRAAQLYKWIYARRAGSLDEMTDLPAAFRSAVAERNPLTLTSLSTVTKSVDGTVKVLFRLRDGREVETVRIPSERVDDDGAPVRRTVCVSTQVGCPLNCRFCATASMKLKRNLSAGEILDQVIGMEALTGERITNLVFMGMGEPMLNYDNVMAATDILIHPENEFLGSKRITLSTSGLVDGIRRMADERRPIKLALSLHATTDGLRSQLMPINNKWALADLKEALIYYYKATKNPVTFEYILFDGLNDTELDARRLAKLTRVVPSKVNVIPFHPIDFTEPEGISAQLRPTSQEAFAHFIALLRHYGATVMIRSSSGKDIHAACGQLALSSIRSTAMA